MRMWRGNAGHQRSILDCRTRARKRAASPLPLSFVEKPAIAAGLASTRAVALARGVIQAMTIYRLKVLFVAAMIGGLIPGGLWAFGGLGEGRREVKAAPEAAAGAPGREGDDRSGIRHIDRIDFGPLHVGAIAEARPGFEFVGARDPGLALKIDVPRFARVKDVRVARRDESQGGGVACMVTLALDTSSAGKLSGPLKVRLGSQEASVPVAASVKAPEAGRPKILLISRGFRTGSVRADYYRPWFDLVEDAGLDVSYMETDSVPVQQNPDVLPEALKRFDVILLANGGVSGLNSNSSQMLVRLAESGKRLIVTATPAEEGAVLHANPILEPLGMHMDESDVDFGFDPARGIVRVESARLRTDPLLDGIRRLAALRPAAIEIRDPDKAKMLAYFPGDQGGFVAVARHGNGEIVAIGMVDLADWTGEGGRNSDNVRFLRNLLTARVGR